MARKKNDLGADIDARLRALMARGGTAESIAKELRAAGVKGASRATVDRRMRELRGRRRVRVTRAPRASARPAPASTAAPDAPLPSPDAIPEGTDLEQIDRWLARAEKAGKEAEAREDIAAMGAMGRLASALLEAKRKAKPPDEPDPNDRPDMKKLAETVAAELHRLIDKALVP